MSPQEVWRGVRWMGWPVLLLVLLGASLPARASDCGGCLNSGLPTSRELRFGLFPGELVLDVSLAGTFGDRTREGDDGARLRDGGLWFENRWVALLGFTHALGLELELPLHVAFTEASRTPRDGAASSALASRTGIGDTWLSLRYARPLGAWTLLATAGVSLPTGRVGVSPGSGATPEERAEAVTALGHGTWDPLVKLALTRRLGPLELLVVAQGQVPLLGGGADRGWGGRLYGSVGLAQQLGHRWRYGLSADVIHTGFVQGAAVAGAAEDGAQTGLLGAAFLQHRVNTWSLRLSGHVPLTRWVHTGGRSDGGSGWRHPFRLHLGLMTAFDVGV